MTEQRIKAHKVTKPIQLLAAWLVGLIIVDGSFLAAAATITSPAWVPCLLVIAAIINVPIFLICIFLLQTKFRPEMQEDSYYSKYLEATTAQLKSRRVDASELHNIRLEMARANKTNLQLIEGLENNINSLTEDISSISLSSGLSSDMYKKLEELESKLATSTKSIKKAKENIDWQSTRIEINDLLPEYKEIVKDMNSLGIPISGTFGSDSHPPEVPKENIISFGNNIEISHLRCIVNLLKRFGFDLINYTSEDIYNGRIYIGSYVYNLPKLRNDVHKIDAATENALSKANTSISSFIKFLNTKARV